MTLFLLPPPRLAGHASSAQGSRAQTNSKPAQATTFAAGAVALFSLSSSAFAADYYLNGSSGNDSNSGTSSSSAFRTFDRLTRSLKPGDTGHVLSGSYSCLYIGVSGQAGKNIIIKGEGSSKPKVWSSTNHCGQNAIYVAPSMRYITIQGFDVESGSNGNGIFLADHVHHVTIAGNSIHNADCNGINSTKGDYLSIHDNWVYANAITSPRQCSGISLYQLTNVDSNSGYHNRIYNNTIFGNYNGVPAPGTTHTTDGHGIIIDDARHTQNGYSATSPAYTGSTQIVNNVIFNNGSQGIRVFLSDNVMIANNTLYLNNWDAANTELRPGEVGVSHSGNVQTYNNIMWCYTTTASTTYHYGYAAQYSDHAYVVADYNLTYGSSTPAFLANSSMQTWGSHNKVGNPLFVSAGKDASGSNAAAINFAVQTNSPAMALGALQYAPSWDRTGASRPNTGPITAGAYQQ